MNVATTFAPADENVGVSGLGPGILSEGAAIVALADENIGVSGLGPGPCFDGATVVALPADEDLG